MAVFIVSVARLIKKETGELQWQYQNILGKTAFSFRWAVDKNSQI